MSMKHLIDARYPSDRFHQKHIPHLVTLTNSQLLKNSNIIDR